MSKQPQPAPAKPSAPPVRYLRLFRGKGEFAPYLGIEELVVQDGKPTVRVLRKPDLVEISLGQFEREALGDAK